MRIPKPKTFKCMDSEIGIYPIERLDNRKNIKCYFCKQGTGKSFIYSLSNDKQEFLVTCAECNKKATDEALHIGKKILLENNIYLQNRQK